MDYSRKRKLGPVTPTQVYRRSQRYRGAVRRPLYAFRRPIVRGKRGKYPPLIDKGIHDEDNNFKGVGYNKEWSNYLLMPQLGQAKDERHAHVFKTWSLNIHGSVHILANPENKGDTVLVDVIVVLDRVPVGSTSPAYSTVFTSRASDSDTSCNLNDFVNADVVSRFKVLRRVRVNLHTYQTAGSGVSRSTWNTFLRFKGRKAMYTEMRDQAGVGNGAYANCKKNCILFFVIFTLIKM
ncbi:coat protein [Camellia oleifera geminivirus]|nr:coat protein [Camellia oleifera geminivirus]